MATDHGYARAPGGTKDWEPVTFVWHPLTQRVYRLADDTCDHRSRRHLGRGWLACNLCGEHTYEEVA